MIHPANPSSTKPQRHEVGPFWSWKLLTGNFIYRTHRIHVWYIYIPIHWVDFYGKCRHLWIHGRHLPIQNAHPKVSQSKGFLCHAKAAWRMGITDPLNLKYCPSYIIRYMKKCKKVSITHKQLTLSGYIFAYNCDSIVITHDYTKHRFVTCLHFWKYLCTHCCSLILRNPTWINQELL